MSEERVMLSGRVPEELKQLIDADPRDNQDIMEAALWREFGGERLGSVERRLEEKRRRLSMVETEENERARERRELEKEIEALEQKKDAVEDERTENREDKLRKIQIVPNDEDHPLVQEVAQELDMTPQQALKEADEL